MRLMAAGSTGRFGGENPSLNIEQFLLSSWAKRCIPNTCYVRVRNPSFVVKLSPKIALDFAFLNLFFGFSHQFLHRLSD